METNSYSINQINNTNYLLSIKGSNINKHKIYTSISDTKILPNAFYNNEDETIFFTAERVDTLKSILTKRVLTMLEAINMVSNLCKQILYLQTHDVMFYGINLDDILIINETNYIIASAICLLDIDDEYISFNSPIILPTFSSPEVINLTKLPSKVDYRTSYYSLGALIIFCLFNVNICFNKDPNPNPNPNTNTILHPISYTKMYWFLKRCVLPNIKERVLLFI